MQTHSFNPNCGHCTNPGASASGQGVSMDTGIPLNTQIPEQLPTAKQINTDSNTIVGRYPSKSVVDYCRNKVHQAAKTGKDAYIKNALDELLFQAKSHWIAEVQKNGKALLFPHPINEAGEDAYNAGVKEVLGLKCLQEKK